MFIKYVEDEKFNWQIRAKYYYNYRKNIILGKTSFYGNWQELCFGVKVVSHYIKKFLEKSLPVCIQYYEQQTAALDSFKKLQCVCYSEHFAASSTWAAIGKLWREGSSTLFRSEPSSLVLQVFQVVEWMCWHSVIIIERIYKTLVCDSFLTCKFPVFSVSTFKGLWQFKGNPLISV